MKTVKDVYEYKNIGFIEELIQARSCKNNIFHETIPVSRTQKTQCIIDITILEINANDIQNVFENIDDLRSNVLYMIGFEKVIEDNVDNVMN